ncbi:ABC transporter permease [Propionispora vibrioides]|nr:ABC transporter permease [Propionispora vibrioides]
MWTYLMKYYKQILLLLGEHILIVVLSVGISLVLAIPIALLVARSKWLSTGALSFFGVIYSIPSLALFSFLIPLFGLGKTTAIVVLVLYNQYILVRNILAGFQSIDPAIIEAGKGMGLDARRLFFMIELPLALPIILGGVRIATVSTIGIATIAAVIHAGGLGVLLFDGLRMNYLPKILWGTVLSSGLAYLGNQGVLALERRAFKRTQGEDRQSTLQNMSVLDR